MDEQTYETLWHYSEQFTRDKLQRSELVTMAWKQGLKMGDRCNIKLMQSVMHFRSKELNIRSAFPTDEVGKSVKDVWNHGVASLDKEIKNEKETFTLSDLLLSTKTTPLDYAITSDFLSSLTEEEKTVLEEMSAGYTQKEISIRHQFKYPQFKNLHRALCEKAIAYL